MTFDSDGTGTIAGRSSTMNISNTSVGTSIVGVSEFSAAFTYTVNSDETVDASIGEVTFTTVLGGGIGSTGTASARSNRLQIGNGAKTLVSAPVTDIKQETLQIDPAVGTPFTQYRLCTRSSTLVRR